MTGRAFSYPLALHYCVCNTEYVLIGTNPHLIEKYRVARDAHIKASEQSDRAFRRWMLGEVKTSRGAGRLAAKVEQTSGEVYYARMLLEDAGIHPDAIDAADGVRHDRGNYHPIESEEA